MSWELIISVGALFVSCVVALYSYYQGKRSNKLQERVVDLEEEREQDRLAEANQAHLVASFTWDREYTGQVRHKLSIRNEGASEARNIRVLVDGERPTDFQHILRDHDTIEVIAPNNQFDYLIAGDRGADPIWLVEVTWDDDYEEGRQIRTELGL